MVEAAAMISTVCETAVEFFGTCTANLWVHQNIQEKWVAFSVYTSFLIEKAFMSGLEEVKFFVPLLEIS